MSLTRFIVAASIAYLWSVPSATAQLNRPTEPPPPPETVEQKSDWSQPPEPRTGDFDWIQLNNGEWLKGEIKDLQDQSFEFESDELDTFKLDWADVAVVHSMRPGTIIFQDRSSIDVASLVVEGSIVTLTTGDGEILTYPRGMIFGAIPGEPSEWNYWSGKLSLSVSVRTGNVDQTDLSFGVNLQRRAPGTRLRIDYRGSYSEVDGSVTANNNRLELSNDVYLSRDFFLRVPTFIALSDEIQNIDYQLTPAVGAGYDIIDDGRFEWTVSGGVGYQFTRFRDVAPGTDETNGETVVTASTIFEWEVTGDIDYDFSFSAVIPVSSNSSGTFHAETGLAIDVWGDLSFDVRVIWDRQGTTADAAAPTRADDVKFLVGLGFEF